MIKYKCLDHWRGFAALWVVVFHGIGIHAKETNYLGSHFPWIEKAFLLGWFGVHLFFVISGFCITANLIEMAGKGAGPGKFLEQRLLRIFPMYWAAAFAQVVLQLVSSLFNQSHWSRVLPPDLLSAFASVLLLEPYFGIPSLMLVSWSLVYEWGFYVLMALALFPMRAGVPGILLLIGGLILAGLGIAGFFSGPLMVLKFWPEFFLGVLVYCFCRVQKGGAREALVSLMVLLPASLFGLEGWTARFFMLGGASFFGLILCLLYPLDGLISSARCFSWLANIGVISYSLYLLHVPFGGAWKNLLSRVITPESPGFLFLQASYWAVSIASAFLFYRWIEAPWEKIRKTRFR